MTDKQAQAIRRALVAMRAVLAQDECGDIISQCSEAKQAILELAYAHDDLREILTVREHQT